MDIKWLLFISAAAGFFVMIGSLVLIAMGRVLVNEAGQSVQEISLPFGFRLKTQYPFVILFFFGTFLLAMPVIIVRQRLVATPTLAVTGRIPLGNSVDGKLAVFARIGPSERVYNEIMLNVPWPEPLPYTFCYVDDKGILFEEPMEWSRVADGKYTLSGFVFTNPNMFHPNGTTPINPPVNAADIIKELPDEVSKFHKPEVSQ